MSKRVILSAVIACLLFVVEACSSTSATTGGSGAGSGGTNNASGTGGAGAGGASIGGVTGRGGASGASAGGVPGTSGTTGPAGTGGTASTGGSKGAGGTMSTVATGGSGTAGMTGTGGAPLGSGGTSGTGGVKNAGGSTGAGGGGVTSTGGATNSKCSGAAATGVFYVDPTLGLDTNDGSTPALAWQSLTKVNATTLQPGGALCFKSGGTWTGQLAPRGAGSTAAPITIDQYGTGNKPSISAGTSDLQALLLFNVQYIEVNNLELSNKKSGPGDYRGISVRGSDVGAVNHVTIRNCFVHDVTGAVNWIGGDVADNQAPWVTFQTGWDASKRTGGIVVEVESKNGTKTWFNDVLIENNVVQDTSFGGIVFKQLDGGYGWGVRSSATDAKFAPHTNIVVRGNYISQTNTSYGCNAIYLTGAQHVVVERNVTKDAGTSAIEIYNADDVKVQYNETFGTVKKAGGADYNGIDADRATTKTIIQYNYVHNNGDGILLCQIAFGNAIVRYNILVNNSRNGINLHSDSSATDEIYNNLFFIDGINSGNLTATSGGTAELAATYALSNNIFHSTRSAASVVTGGGVSYANNLFDGVAAVGTAAQTGAAVFVNSAVRPSGDQSGPALSALAGLKVSAGSPAINHGVSIANNGGVDFWGDTLYTGTPDIGPYEAP